jgi:hypothetical protein
MEVGRRSLFRTGEMTRSHRPGLPSTHLTLRRTGSPAFTETYWTGFGMGGMV